MIWVLIILCVVGYAVYRFAKWYSVFKDEKVLF
jgi:hypothetical protein